MTDVQVRGKKIALLDSSDNIIYTLPDSAGTAGNAIVTDGAGKLFFGGINLNSVLTAGDSSNLNATILGNVTLGDVTIKTLQFTGFEGIGANATHGYTAGGRSSPPGTAQVTEGFRFSIASGASESIGNTIAQKKELGAGFASSTHGYSAGGRHGSPTAIATDEIAKYTLSSSASAIDVGNLSAVRFSIGTGGQQSNTHGYVTGGHTGPTGSGLVNINEKVSFTSDANSVDVGDLTVAKQLTSKSSSSTHGYDAGGGIPTSTVGIDKFPFATDTNSSNVSNLNAATTEHGGTSSGLHGYTIGGRTVSPGGTPRSDIQKFPFSIDLNATDVGDISPSAIGPSGHASSSHGFRTGGGTFPPFNTRGQIDTFPFSSSGNATNVGDLPAERYGTSGTQG